MKKHYETKFKNISSNDKILNLGYTSKNNFQMNYLLGIFWCKVSI